MLVVVGLEAFGCRKVLLVLVVLVVVVVVVRLLVFSSTEACCLMGSIGFVSFVTLFIRGCWVLVFAFNSFLL